jgi:hypothetical protein
MIVITMVTRGLTWLVLSWHSSSGDNWICGQVVSVFVAIFVFVRSLFKNLMKEMQMYAQKFIDKGKNFNLRADNQDHDYIGRSQVCFLTLTLSTSDPVTSISFNSSISKLYFYLSRYSLATGNWRDQKKDYQARPGISQVTLNHLYLQPAPAPS